MKKKKRSYAKLKGYRWRCRLRKVIGKARKNVNKHGENLFVKDHNGEICSLQDDIPINESDFGKVTVGGSSFYKLHSILGSGGFAQVYLGKREMCSPLFLHDANLVDVAVKLEPSNSEEFELEDLPHEWSFYRLLNGTKGIPKVYYTGKFRHFFVMIMDLLGPSLWDLWSSNDSLMSEDMVAYIAINALNILERIHAQGYVHGDVKPENILLGRYDSGLGPDLCFIDLGLVTRWYNPNRSSHVDYDQRLDMFRGTIRYASVHSQLGRTASRRDDIESLAYTLLYLLNGRLPWQGWHGETKEYAVLQNKISTSPEMLCQTVHKAFRLFTEAAVNLKFDEEPQYALYKSWFQQLCLLEPGRLVPQMKIYMLTLQQEDWPRDSNDQYCEYPTTAGEAKKIRTGFFEHQWIMVFNSYLPMKQRYFYNLSSKNLNKFLRKSAKDGMHISCTTSHQDLWIIVMDNGTQFTKQVYHLNTHFLPRKWIMKKWNNGYFLSSVAGGRTTMVTMSRGTLCTQQSYKVADSFPYRWINKKWNEGFFVTCLTTSEMQWAVVASKNAGFVEQCIELDLHYPSEGINRRWRTGFRITGCTGTTDQLAFVLSVPYIQNINIQETLRTRDFPHKYIRERWSDSLYISDICYAPTMS